jgi:hypothetical protein
MLNAIIVTIAIALTGYLAFSKRVAGSSNWRATVTPLASIMGSGFLTLRPDDLRIRQPPIEMSVNRRVTI